MKCEFKYFQSSKMLYVASVPLHLLHFWIPYAQHFRSKNWVVDGASADITQWRDLEGVLIKFLTSICSQPATEPWPPCRHLCNPQHIRSLVAEQGYDIVHVSTPTAAFMVRLALRGAEPHEGDLTAHGFHFFKGNSLHSHLLFRGLERMAAGWTMH